MLIYSTKKKFKTGDKVYYAKGFMNEDVGDCDIGTVIDVDQYVTVDFYGAVDDYEREQLILIEE